MPTAHLEPLLLAGLKALGLPPDAAPALLAYVAELQKWNGTYNLTAIRDPAEMVTRHVLDSLAVLPVVRERLPAGETPRLLDVGAGAGLPSIPLAIVWPALQVSAIDSVGKKVRFLRHVQRQLKLAHFTPLEGRVEALPAVPGFEIITSRAFASLADFFNLTRHLLTDNGVWVAMKGKLEADEQAAIPADVAIIEVRRLAVPGLHEARHAVIATQKKP